MQLLDIKKFLENIKIYRNRKDDLSFNQIHTNSKNIVKKSIFAIVDHKKIKEIYIKDAIKRGAIAILTKKLIPKLNITQVVVKDINHALLILLKKLKPFEPLNAIAITGTNGKTSVVWYISQLLVNNGFPVKSFGTLGYYVNGIKKKNSLLTTPENEILYQNAYSKNYNKYHFIFEASSHSLDQDRLKDIQIDIAAITNITHDHLDYHKNFINYKKSKLKLFTKYLKNEGYAIINDNIKAVEEIKNKLLNKNKIITYGKITSDINVYVKNNFTIIKIFKKKYQIKLMRKSKIELENISCAIACCLSANIKITDMIKNLKKISNAPGRLQLVENKKKYNVFIDYAHTPDALKKILINNTNTQIKPNIVFGCGGNRDTTKRKEMGIIAQQYANKVYITDDNPRDEDPGIIRKSIIDYCKKGIEIPSRKLAINMAISELKKNEVLIIAGKGHENTQIIKNSIKILNDYNISKIALKNKI